jgi:hypothetical protein
MPPNNQYYGAGARRFQLKRFVLHHGTMQWITIQDSSKCASRHHTQQTFEEINDGSRFYKKKTNPKRLKRAIQNDPSERCSNFEQEELHMHR